MRVATTTTTMTTGREGRGRRGGKLLHAKEMMAQGVAIATHSST